MFADVVEELGREMAYASAAVRTHLATQDYSRLFTSDTYDSTARGSPFQATTHPFFYQVLAKSHKLGLRLLLYTQTFLLRGDALVVGCGKKHSEGENKRQPLMMSDNDKHTTLT